MAAGQWLVLGSSPRVQAGNAPKPSLQCPGLVTVLGQGQVAPGSTGAALIQLQPQRPLLILVRDCPAA